MLRQNRNVKGLNKIRKRGCSSTSSTSSCFQNYRFKRAILVGKRGGGSTTPVPTWRISSRSPYRHPESPMSCKAKQTPVSARKLAATLWEMNEMPSPTLLENNRNNKEMRSRDRMSRRSVQSGSHRSHLSDPSHSPPSEKMDRYESGSHRRQTSSISRRLLRLTDYNAGGFDSRSSASLMEIEMRSRAETPSGSVVGNHTRLKDLSSCLTTSKELLKILKRFWGVEEQRSSSLSLISALHTELERACVQVDQLAREKRSEKHEIDYLMKLVTEEKAVWKSMEKEKIRDAVETISGDLEAEKKMRRRSESLNKKLGSELAETKAALSKALKEVESEKRAREIMEQMCDELARGVGEDKAEAEEELKRETARVWEEVEKEKEMLQLADMLREERLQMKLSDAKYQFEEKNAAVDQLKNQLETILRAENVKETKIGPRNDKSKANIENQTDDKGEDDSEVEDGEENKERVDSEEDSAESDLHSIELNMENLSRSYRWNHTPRAPQEDPRRVSVAEEIKGRKSVTDKIPRRSISLEKRIPEGIDWDLNGENFANIGDLNDWGRDKQNRGQHSEDEMQRYKSFKDQKQHIFAGSQMASGRSFASPTRQWGQPWPSRDPGNAASERGNVLRESVLKPRLVETKGGESRSSRRLRQ